MKSIAELVSIALLSGLLASCASEQRTTVNSDRIVTNPIDLNYRFQPNEESRRKLPIRYWNILKDIIICLLPSPVVIGAPKTWQSGNIFLVQLFRLWRIMRLQFLFMVIHFTLPLPVEIPGFIRMLIRKKMLGKKWIQS